MAAIVGCELEVKVNEHGEAHKPRVTFSRVLPFSYVLSSYVFFFSLQSEFTQIILMKLVLLKHGYMYLRILWRLSDCMFRLRATQLLIPSSKGG